jgi:solute carrier family 25 phosphate transporter 3
MSGQAQIGISVVCGISAGVLSSLASHPADTILSRINMAAKSGAPLSLSLSLCYPLHLPLAAPTKLTFGTGKEVQSIRTIARELGWKGLWLGAGTRCIFTGLLSATIFLVYDSVKLLFGLQTTSGLNSKEDAPAVE